MRKAFTIVLAYFLIVWSCNRACCNHQSLTAIHVGKATRKFLLLPSQSGERISLIVIVSQFLLYAMVVIYAVAVLFSDRLLPYAEQINGAYTLALKAHLMGGPLLSLLDIGICYCIGKIKNE